MDDQIEDEICNNCKKPIPQQNYVMHTAHCGRNITLCQLCEDPVPKSQFADHKKTCVAIRPKREKPLPPPAHLEQSLYYQNRKSIEDKKIAARKERQMQKYERMVDVGYSMKNKENVKVSNENKTKFPTDMLTCQFCELELPRTELGEHEDYCGARTDNCSECGKLVMFKDKQIHMDTKHAFLNPKNEPNLETSTVIQHNIDNQDSCGARGIIQCQVCRKVISKSQFADHEKTCVAVRPKVKKPLPPPTDSEWSRYYQERKSIEDKKIAARKQRQMEKYEKMVDVDHFMKSQQNRKVNNERKALFSVLLVPCKFCSLQLSRMELVEHEGYCGTRMEKCLECGTMITLKDKQFHMHTKHAFVKRKNEFNPGASIQRSTFNVISSVQRPYSSPLMRPSVHNEDKSEKPASASRTSWNTAIQHSFVDRAESFPNLESPGAGAGRNLNLNPLLHNKFNYVGNTEDEENYTEILRRMDTLMFQPPEVSNEETIPCEFCHVQIPLDDLSVTLHQTGCRPDLARV